MSDRFETEKRACIRTLERMGLVVDFTLRGASVEAGAHQRWEQTATPADRIAANLVESLLTGLRAFEWGEHRLALRCALQTQRYLGRMGGLWSGLSAEHDAYIGLQNALEAALCSGEASNG